MIRLLVIALSVFGCYVLVGRAWPQSGMVAFTVAQVGITWLMLASVCCGTLAYKVTK